eukprot:TRINITY_DN58605_c0_g3_i1.p1 TRINITY_DN58605_c0_g3~~TRINITY_DN58605_c0_g3_i1.p1  ORF type:complete len:203 (-),score=47.88 TRINITY_DN58605_c0_g3_i1:119-727(-)
MAVASSSRPERRRAIQAAVAAALVAGCCLNSLSAAWSAYPARHRQATAEHSQACSRLVNAGILAASPRSPGVAMQNSRHISLPHYEDLASRQNSRVYEFDEDGGMYDIIKYPLLTEKACRLIEEENTYAFMVDRRANKPQIRAAVETIFGVKVKKIQTLIPKAKYTIQMGKKVGRKSVFKKAYLRLEDGFSIDLFPDDPEVA